MPGSCGEAFKGSGLRDQGSGLRGRGPAQKVTFFEVLLFVQGLFPAFRV